MKRNWLKIVGATKGRRRTKNATTEVARERVFFKKLPCDLDERG